MSSLAEPVDAVLCRPSPDVVNAMEKRAIFSSKILPYLLLLPQMAVTIIFFYWPASQAIWQSFLMEDAFGVSSEFVGFENYRLVFEQPEYYRAMVTTIVFSTLVA